jgi:hypothetical protein
MSPKSFVVLAFWIIAIVLFVLVGLAIPDTKYNLVALGLGFAWAGMTINTFVA